MDTKDTEHINGTKPSHQDECKALHDEITLYQHEMHRTWLWAIIPAGAVYTWLPLHRSAISTDLPWFVWFIPSSFFFFCWIRYRTFGIRIKRLGEYLYKIEEDAFGKEKELRGLAHYNLEDPDQKSFVTGAHWVWWVLIFCSFALSLILSLTKSNGTPNRGPAYGHKQEFRQQLADSVPVKDWGYKIQDIRFSEDYHKALVVFAVPGKTAVPEVVLEEDGFRRYKGSVRDYDKVAAAKPGDLATQQAWTASITVTLPDK